MQVIEEYGRTVLIAAKGKVIDCGNGIYAKRLIVAMGSDITGYLEIDEDKVEINEEDELEIM